MKFIHEDFLLNTRTAVITVNSTTAYRTNRYFRAELSVDNTANPLWLTVTNLAVMPNGASSYVVSNVTGHVFVPETPETFYYDLDGNLTNDGRWILRWDGENRLTAMEKKSDAPSGSELMLLFTYDWQGRRISKTVSNVVSGNWQLQSTNKFVYDGWNLIAVLSPSSVVQQSFVWGLDLSGTMQGAGGVGGLLAVNDSANGAHFCAYDANGNVGALVKASDGTVSANYEYGPFGELVRATGLMAKANPFRFSTKYQDDESDLLYYGYRSYNPTMGRWLNRDPIGERGGNNLYACVHNDPSNRSDKDGREAIKNVDCSDACGLAKELKMDNGNVGGIICCKGQIYPCVWDEGGATDARNEKARKIISKCIYAHENDHAKKESCFSCGSIYRPKPWPWKLKALECAAYKVELQCLQDSLSDCGGDHNCEVDVKTEIGSVKEYIDDYCGSK